MNAITTDRPSVTVGQRVRVIAAYPSYSDEERTRLIGRVGTVRNATPDADGDIQVEDLAEDNPHRYYYIRQWALADTPREFTSNGMSLLAADVPGWEAGIKVTVTGHTGSGYEGLVGVTYTSENGYALFRGYQGSDLMNWTRLTEVVESNPVGPPTEEDITGVPEDPEITRLKAEVARLQKREDDLLDAMYEEARDRSWGEALTNILDAVGIAKRPVPVKVVLDVKRRVYLSVNDLTEHGQRAAHLDPNVDVIHGQTVWTQRVTTTLPDVTECDHESRYTVAEDAEKMTAFRQAAADAFHCGLGAVQVEDVSVIRVTCGYCG